MWVLAVFHYCIGSSSTMLRLVCCCKGLTEHGCTQLPMYNPSCTGRQQDNLTAPLEHSGVRTVPTLYCAYSFSAGLVGTRVCWLVLGSQGSLDAVVTGFKELEAGQHLTSAVAATSLIRLGRASTIHRSQGWRSRVQWHMPRIDIALLASVAPLPGSDRYGVSLSATCAFHAEWQLV